MEKMKTINWWRCFLLLGLSAIAVSNGEMATEKLSGVDDWILQSMGKPPFVSFPGGNQNDIIGITEDGILGLIDANNGSLITRHALFGPHQRPQYFVGAVDRWASFFAVTTISIKNSTNLMTAEYILFPHPQRQPRPDQSIYSHLPNSQNNVLPLWKSFLPLGTLDSKVNFVTEANNTVLPSGSSFSLLEYSQEHDLAVIVTDAKVFHMHMVHPIRNQILKKSGWSENITPNNFKLMSSSHTIEWPGYLMSHRNILPEAVRNVSSEIVFAQCRVIKIWDFKAAKTGFSVLTFCPMLPTSEAIRSILFTLPFDVLKNNIIETDGTGSSVLLLNFPTRESSNEFVVNCFNPLALSGNRYPKTIDSVPKAIGATCAFSRTSMVMRHIPETVSVYSLNSHATRVLQLTSIIPSIKPNDNIQWSFLEPEILQSEQNGVRTVYALNSDKASGKFSARRLASFTSPSEAVGSVYKCPAQKFECSNEELFVLKFSNNSVVLSYPNVTDQIHDILEIPPSNSEDSSMESTNSLYMHYSWLKKGNRFFYHLVHSSGFDGTIKSFDFNKTQNPLEMSHETSIGDAKQTLLIYKSKESIGDGDVPSGGRAVSRHERTTLELLIRSVMKRFTSSSPSEGTNSTAASEYTPNLERRVHPITPDEDTFDRIEQLNGQVTTGSLMSSSSFPIQSIVISTNNHILYGLDGQSGIVKWKITTLKDIKLYQLKEHFPFVFVMASEGHYWLDTHSGALTQVKSPNQDYYAITNKKDGMFLIDKSAVKDMMLHEGQQHSAAIGKVVKPIVIPAPGHSVSQVAVPSEPYRLVLKKNNRVLMCLVSFISTNEVKLSVGWSYHAGKSERLVSLILSSDKPGHLVAPVKVLPNVSVMVKTSTEDMLGIVSEISSPDSESAVQISFVSLINGRVILSQTLPSGASSKSMNSILFENMFVSVYKNIRKHRYELKVVEFYSNAAPLDLTPWQVVKQFIFKWKSDAFSSVMHESTNVDGLMFFDQTYVLDRQALPTSLSITRTLQNVTPRSLLMHFPDTNSLVRFHPSFLSARRYSPNLLEDGPQGPPPPSAADVAPYHPLLTSQSMETLSRALEVLQVKSVHSVPLHRESATFVLAVGTDIFATTLHPATAFDSLSADFPYALVICTLSALALGVYFANKMQNSNKILKLWQCT